MKNLLALSLFLSLMPSGELIGYILLYSALFIILSKYIKDKEVRVFNIKK